MWSISHARQVPWASLWKSLPFEWILIVCHVTTGTVRRHSPRDRGWVFQSHLPSFFSEILFFWKLVSHGGLDFSIFVSSTIWNQCFRSKNCSTALLLGLAPLPPPEPVQEGSNLKSKVHPWVCWVWRAGSAGRGLCLKTLGFEQGRGCDALCVDM